MINKFYINGTPIFLGYNSVSKIDYFLKKELFTQIFILVDCNTKQYCLEKFLSQSIILKNSKIIELPTGESTKSIDTSSPVEPIVMY